MDNNFRKIAQLISDFETCGYLDKSASRYVYFSQNECKIDFPHLLLRNVFPIVFAVKDVFPKFDTHNDWKTDDKQHLILEIKF